MCGIAGIVDTKRDAPIDRQLVERMNEVQHHRGPDEGGVFMDPGVGLAHRRLSIIDVSMGRQPLFNEDESVVVVYNGEIYNFPELTSELMALGHRFATHTDTEVIVHAWEEWGVESVKRFRGMFAFAVWDRRSKSLFLARDRLGIKPLYYALLDDGMLLFASELKSLLLHPRLPRRLEPRAVEAYLALGYVPEPHTIFQGVSKLEPGHTLLVERGRSFPAPRQYWDVDFDHHVDGSEEEIAAELIDRLREAVKIRMVAEVPLGAFLSGGVDSSAVVAMMAGVEPDKRVQTCSIAFDDPRFNEAEFARQVAERYRTDHYVEKVAPERIPSLTELAGLYDEPFADSSAIPTYRLCELARKKVTVALSGDGGDENLSGYRRHRWHAYEERARRLLPHFLRRPVFGMLAALYPKMDWGPKALRAKSTFQALAKSSLEAYLHTVSFIPEHLRRRIYSGSFRRELQGYDAIEVFRNHDRNAPHDDPLKQIEYIDLKTYLPGDILTKVDRASMAHALEVRVPILDHELVEWMAGIPTHLKLKGREGKYIFKKALEPYLPHDIMYRPKMGFAVPMAKWFRDELRNELKARVLGSRMAESGIFEMRILEGMIDDHLRGRSDHATALWTLLMFDAFLENIGAGEASGTVH